VPHSASTPLVRANKTMKTEPLTSVVIPAYNAELFIERTLRSVLRQTYSNLEVIVVNDGSADKTRVIAESVAATDDRVRIISVPNGGVAKARNTGLTEATGEFVAFLDADDLWHPTKIERQVAAMNREQDDYQPAAVYTFSRVLDTDDRVTGNGRRVVLGGYCFARYLYARPVGNGSSILVRRQIAVNTGGFDPTWAARGMGGSEDLDFELRIAANHPITSVGLYLVGYREYPGTMSSNALSMARGAVSTIAHHVDSCPDLPDWAARSARASILEYALDKLIAGRHSALALQEFAVLIRTDFGRGLKFAATIGMGKLSALISAKPIPEMASDVRPFFYDVSPEFLADSSGKGRQSRDQKIVDRLETVDAVLAERIAKASTVVRGR
jgi:Glycosyl transferase family 2